ncbi:MAG: hypothetical protein JXA78_01685 [Anaerolineales bacterium]|nr:hypothetical protein [Anaerolineales bacterium]
MVRKILREYRVEIIAALVALLGVFLIVERLEIRESARAVLTWLAAILRQAAATIQGALIAYVASFTLSDLTGWILIALTSVFIVWRIRHRFSRSSYWEAGNCPRCGGALRRTHRTLLDRLLSWMLLPRARRYTCASSECGWSGLRRHKRRVV